MPSPFPKLPLFRPSSLLHWGNLSSPDPANTQRTGSHEGCLLSCSPSIEAHEAWLGIARLGGIGEWVLTKPLGENFALLDIHALSTSARGKLLKTAAGGGLVRHGTAQKVTSDDGESGECFSLYPTLEEAKAADSEGAIETVPAWFGTDKLQSYWWSRRSRGSAMPVGLLFVEDAAIAALLDAGCPSVDGIFWNDELDPAAFSSPRVGLFQRAVRASTILSR